MAPRQWTCGYCLPSQNCTAGVGPAINRRRARRAGTDLEGTPVRAKRASTGTSASVASPARGADRARKNPPRRASRVRNSGCCRAFARETLPVSTVVCVRAEGCVVLRVVSLSRLTRFRSSCLLGAKPNHGFFDCQQPRPRKSAAYVARHPSEVVVDAARRGCRRHAHATSVEQAIAKNAAFYALFCNSGRTRPALRVRPERHAEAHAGGSTRSCATAWLGAAISRCNTPNCAKSAQRTIGWWDPRAVRRTSDPRCDARPITPTRRWCTRRGRPRDTNKKPATGAGLSVVLRTPQWSSSSSSSA